MTEDFEKRWYRYVGQSLSLYFSKDKTYKFVYNADTQRWECDNHSSALAETITITRYELEKSGSWVRVDPPEKRENVKYFERVSPAQPRKYTQGRVYVALYKQDRGRWTIVDNNGKETIPSLQEPDYWKEVPDMSYNEKSGQTNPSVSSPPVIVEDTVLINGCPISDYDKDSLVYDIIKMSAYRKELEKLNTDIGTSRWMSERIDEASMTINRLKQLIDEE